MNMRLWVFSKCVGNVNSAVVCHISSAIMSRRRRWFTTEEALEQLMNVGSDVEEEDYEDIDSEDELENGEFVAKNMF